MLGVYSIINGKIAYDGNNVTKPLDDLTLIQFSPLHSQNILNKLADSEHYLHLHNIDDAVFNASVEYFRSIKASWCNLPLTTKMISSPGEVYAGKKLDYTTDALPVTVDWFNDDKIFLAESSQFYLELRLLIDNLDKVFSIYNSFRKEKADFSHLAEFQHIEFEGQVSFKENIEIYTGLLKYITNYIIEHNYSDLAYYLSEKDINDLRVTFNDSNIHTITFNDAMKLLAENFNDNKYLNISLKNFGSFEEIALTRIVGKHCNVIEFPLEEIPFYHDISFEDKKGKRFARNSDFILLGYRETVGSGQRITDIDAIRAKAEFFNLPLEDYEPYIELRNMKEYQTSCGFGMGWQRYTQWLLKLPFIWEASHIPRGHFTPHP